MSFSSATTIIIPARKTKLVLFREKLYNKFKTIIDFLFNKNKNKFWNGEKWQTDYYIFKFIKVSKLELMRGHPCSQYIIDKTWKIGLIKSFTH